MGTTPATTKQLKFLQQLTGKDYSDEELTASEASKRIEKALANKGKEVTEANLSPQPSDKLLPEHQKVIDEAVAEVKGIKQEPPAPQAVGMTTKELGDMIRAKYLMPIFGNEAGTELIKWYRGQILGTTRISYDGSKLPDLKKKEEP